MKNDRGNLKLRFFDRYFGIPLVFLLGLIHKKKSKPGNIPRRIGILETAAIGDTILLSPVIEEIKKKYQKVEIIFFCGKDNLEIVKEIKGVNEIVVLSIKNLFKAVKMIRGKGLFDVWVDFGPWPRINSILSFFARSKYKIGFNSKNQYKHYLFDKAVKHEDNCHEIENYRRIAGEIGVVSEGIPLFKKKGKIKNQVVVHMFPGGFKAWNKEWQAKNWIKVINFITDRGYQVIITGGKSDIIKADPIVKKCKNQKLIDNITGKTSLSETAQYILEARLTISVNTGILHLAAALDSRVIALQGPTSVLRWGGLGNHVFNINSTKDCAPCLHFGFDYKCKEADCMDYIEPARVIDSIKNFLK